MTEDQVAELKAAQEKLTTSAQSLFTKMYENMQQANAGAGPDMSGMGNMGGAQTASEDQGADDVVDGDYREV